VGRRQAGRWTEAEIRQAERAASPAQEVPQRGAARHGAHAQGSL